VICTNNNFIYLLPLFLFRRQRAIFVLHGYGAFSLRICVSLLMAYLASFFGSVMFVSNSELTRSFYSRFLKIESRVIYFIDIAGDVSFKPTKALGEGVLRCLLPGRDVHHKNIRWSLSALDYVCAKHDLYIDVVVFSDVTLDNNWLNLNIQSSGFVSHQEYISQLNSADLVVSMGELEPYGLVIEEAIMHGVPVVCHLYSGCVEVNKLNVRAIPIRRSFIEMETAIINLFGKV